MKVDTRGNVAVQTVMAVVPQLGHMPTVVGGTMVTAEDPGARGIRRASNQRGAWTVSLMYVPSPSLLEPAIWQPPTASRRNEEADGGNRLADPGLAHNAHAEAFEENYTPRRERLARWSRCPSLPGVDRLVVRRNNHYHTGITSGNIITVVPLRIFDGWFHPPHGA